MYCPDFSPIILQIGRKLLFLEEIMEIVNIKEIIAFDDQSATPKYQQLINSIIRGIQQGLLFKKDSLPSINDLSFEFEVSRDTIERGYRQLKSMGILGSVPGKGYFIKSTDVNQPIKLFLLFNKLSAHKKIIYDSLVNTLGDQASIDFYIYNNDYLLFKKLIQSKVGDYTHYVIVPHFIEGGENAHEIINKIDKDKLIVLDKLVPKVTGEFGAVFENFEQDIFSALKQALEPLSKYTTLKIIFPKHSYFPVEILKGFNRFCDEFAFTGKVVDTIAEETILRGEVYINLMEDDLVRLIEKILATNLVVGKDVGVISYNETPLKKVILSGITTISTDFMMMGEEVARMILSNTKELKEVPFYLTLRPSL